MAAPAACTACCNSGSTTTPMLGSGKQLAVLQGELDGIVCKLSGYERALQDCEMELAERDLQVVILKSFLKHMDSPDELQLDSQEVLAHNHRLQQQLQELSLTTHAAPARPAEQSATMQIALLRAALAEANYRLAAAGLLPVAATGMQHTGSQERPTSTSASTRRSYSRLFRDKHNTATAISNPAGSSSSGVTPSGSTGSPKSPNAPALCLNSKTSGAAAHSDGPDTPVGLDSKAPAHTPHQQALLTSSACATPAPHTMPATTAPAAAAASTLALTKAETTVAGSLDAAFGAVADAEGVGAADLSCADDTQSAPTTTLQPAQSAPGSPIMCLLGSPGRALTPPCSPCSISCEGAGMRHSYAAPVRLSALAGWPGVTCSCDNPLFAEEYGDRLGY